jgi:LPS export ABC transporter permease LptF/LPS export ABC transporter permease LptG
VRLIGALRPTLLDRYVIHEIVPPTFLGLLVFTFILLLQQITILTGNLIARSAPPATILRVFLNLLPSILSVTIPMAFLLGVLLAFGRFASDSEIVALRASGVSPGRLLRPVLVVATAAFFLTFYVMAVALPAANQAYIQLMFSLVVRQARTSVKPRVFSNDLLRSRTIVLFVSDIPAGTGEWKDVFVHDTRDPRNPRVILARGGRLVIDENEKTLELHLEKGVLHSSAAQTPETYEQQYFRTLDLPLPFDALVPPVALSKGERELNLRELTERIRSMDAAGKGEAANSLRVERHKKYAIPTACFVFGLLGLALSLGSRKEARSAAFALSIAVIFVYYVFIKLGEHAGDTGLISPFFGMWSANLVLGALALGLLVLNHREAAFDPLEPSHYTAWLPRLRRATRPAPIRGAESRYARRRAPALVVRLPRLSLRFPGILDRYITKQCLGHLLLVGIAFWALFVLGEFIDLFDDIQHNKVKGKVVFHYYAFHGPAIVHLIAPVAVLVATLTTFGLLSRRNEITAMKAGGVSLYRATLPVLVLGIVASFGLFAAEEFVLPQTNLVAHEDFNIIKGRPPKSSNFLERRWMLGSDGRLYNYDHASPGEGPEGITLFGLTIYDIDTATWDLRDRLFAARADWRGDQGVYDLQRGWRRSFGDRATFRAFNEVRSRELEKPSYFRQEERGPDTFGFGQLRDHIAKLETLGLDVVKLRVQLHKKPAFPFVGIVMTLIGIPFSFSVGRRGALYGIGLSIVIAIVYWACLGIFEALGNNALLPPVLAAWAPNLLFGAAGLYLMLTLET